MVYFSALPQAHNLVQNICRLFHVLAQLFSTTNETELVFISWNARVALRVAKRLKTWDFSKLGNFKKIPEMLAYERE